MKSVKKVLKAKLMKRAAAVMLSGVLLCGQGMSVAAATASAVQGTSEHICEFKVPEWHLIGFAPYGSHQYMSGVKIHEDGTLEPAYSTCNKSIYVYAGVWTCEGCGATNGPADKSEVKHSSCGQ